MPASILIVRAVDVADAVCPLLHLVAAGKLRERIRCRFFKSRQPATKYEFNLVGGAVALLGDQDVGHVALFGRGIQVEKTGPVNEHDHVGILLDGARFAQVRKLRPALFAFRRARQLAKHQHGNLQFLGETFQSAGDAGDFFLAGVESPARGDQLQIVDD